MGEGLERMLSPEIETRYLRPATLKDSLLDSSWGDQQHAWVPRDGATGFVKVKVIEPSSTGGGEATIELPDRTVARGEQEQCLMNLCCPCS